MPATRTVISAGRSRVCRVTPASRALADRDGGGEVEDDERDQDGEVRGGRAPVGVLSADGEPDRAEGGQDRDRPGRQEPRRGGRELAACLLGGLVQQGGGLLGVEVAAVAGGVVVSGVGFMVSPSIDSMP